MPRVMSVKGKKVLHIDRNDHYGGLVCLDVFGKLATAEAHLASRLR